MAGIFVSYRRQDSADATGRIHDHLDMYFGPDATFRDIDRIQIGANFPEVLQNALDKCNVVIAIIGDGWISSLSAAGTRRLDDPGDFVRIELVTAIKRRVPIIPVLVGTQGMPSARDLPVELASLTHTHAMTIPSGRGFSLAVRELAREISKIAKIPFDDYSSAMSDCRETGLVMIRDNFRSDSTVLDEMISSKDLLVVMNDGRGWLDQNREIIHRRLMDQSSITRVVLLHPRSPFLKILIKKNKKKMVEQVGDIRQTFMSLIANANAGSRLETKGHFGFNGYSLIVGDDHAFLSPYFFNESGALPLLKFSSRADTGLYFSIKNDAEKLFSNATSLTTEDFAK